MKTTSRLIGISTEKDKNSIVIQCNNVFLEYAGLKSADQVLGKTDYDFPWNNYADIYRAHELDALSGNHYSTILPLKNHNDEDLIFLHTKIAKIDEHGNTVGIICRAIEIIDPSMCQLINLLSQGNPSQQSVYFLGKNHTKVKLSTRQKEILFYLARGKSAKAISILLSLSVRTVENYIDILRDKLDCRTRLGLIDYARTYDFSNALPLQDSPKQLIKKIKS